MQALKTATTPVPCRQDLDMKDTEAVLALKVQTLSLRPGVTGVAFTSIRTSRPTTVAEALFVRVDVDATPVAKPPAGNARR